MLREYPTTNYFCYCEMHLGDHTQFKVKATALDCT